MKPATWRSRRFQAVELGGDDAAWLRGTDLPPDVEVHERLEVDFFGRTFVEQRSGLLLPDSVDPVDRFVRERLDEAERSLPRPVGVDLFCGAGGFSLGLHEAGFDVLAAAEWDAIAARTYLANLGHPDCRVHHVGEGAQDRWRKEEEKARRRGEVTDAPWIGADALASRGQQDRGCRDFYFGDVAQLEGARVLEAVGGEVAVVFGGPPCQGLSRANPRACLEDSRNALIWEFMRLVAEIRPRAFIIENVPQILTVAKGALFEAICQLANDAGYNVVAQKLCASWYGVPQYRRRAIIVGTAEGTAPYRFPMPTHWGIGRRTDGGRWNMSDPDGEGSPLEAEFDPETRTWTAADENDPSPQKDLFG